MRILIRREGPSEITTLYQSLKADVVITIIMIIIIIITITKGPTTQLIILQIIPHHVIK